MKILVLSDIHNRSIELSVYYDYIICCGDYGIQKEIFDNNHVLYVRGNCDRCGDKEIITTINNTKVFITHGDLYNVKMTFNNLYYKAMSVDAKIVFFGHTHQQAFFKLDNTYFINSGAYKDGCFAEIIDNEIIFYNKNQKERKEIEW